MKPFIFLWLFFSFTNHTMSQTTHLPKRFPPIPLNGLFRVVESHTKSPLPPLEQLPPNGYGGNLLFPGQVVRFFDLGEWGDDRPDWLSNEMTLYPPFNPGICQHQKFYYVCKDKNGPTPNTPITRNMIVAPERLREDFESIDPLSVLTEFGAKKGKYIYPTMFADQSGAFGFYFQNWNTLISRGTYWTGRNKASYGPTENREIDELKPNSVIQILKRIKE